MLGISPWYVFLVCVSDTLAGIIFYHQRFQSFNEIFSSLGGAGCYAMAAYLLRGPLRIDLVLVICSRPSNGSCLLLSRPTRSRPW
jgi:hypothetical protein